MYNLKRFVMHMFVQEKRQRSVRQRRRYADVSSFTVSLGAFLNR